MTAAQLFQTQNMIPNILPQPATMAASDNNRQRRSVVISPPRTVPTRPSVARKPRRSSLRQQVEDCTRLAVLHLTEKVSPITSSPLLRLLNDMSYQFTSSRQADSDIFDLLHSNEHSTEHSKGEDDSTPRALRSGIGEIGVSYIEMKSEKPPEHYSILSRSITGRSSGNLAKHGSRKTYLFYRNANETEKPITAICLIDTSNGEEAECTLSVCFCMKFNEFKIEHFSF